MENLKCTSLHGREQTSLSSLIIWNISKALEKSPTLNIKEAVAATQNHLEHVSDAREIQSILANNPYERHLACALLAWQQLGHSGTDSLCRFVENKAKKIERLANLSNNCGPFASESLSRTRKESKINKMSPDTDTMSQQSGQSRDEGIEQAHEFTSFNSFSMGPVIKLPVETQVVMRLENTSHSHGRKCGQAKKPRAPERDIIRKIDQACCLDSACAERLAALDATSAELRARVGTLARREAERVELLERAEAAWKDLELGYQRRLALAQEKEEDIAKQISKLLDERVSYKNACSALEKDLKDRTGRAEVEQAALSELEKVVCERACQRLKVSEESAKGDAIVAEQSCKAAQLDRDLQFKEETARRNLVTLQGEVAAIRALTCESERATRSELSALRDQIAEVSKDLLQQDAITQKSKAELEDLRQEKKEIIEDLDGCKVICDGNMQGLINELKAKRDQLTKLRMKVMDCKCKVPIEVSVEVKRTPSLAALCKCTPEDKVLESCSCTSMRTKLLSNLFADLFAGLQTELKGAITIMPCQLLKCLEDKHNWDRSSIVKTNLKNYFSKLLVGELDIAIATSIENYHAKWVGISCADARSKMSPGPGDDTESEGWQERAIERRAQMLATQLAEQLFQERAEELTQRAQRIVNAGPPPCECDVKAKLPEGCSCVKSTVTRATDDRDRVPDACIPESSEPETQVYWHQAVKDVKQLPVQDPKKVGGQPERDFNVEVEKKLARKSYGKGGARYGGDTRKNASSVKNAKEIIVCPGIARNQIALSPPTGTTLSWQQAIQDVTSLRHQIEDLKKDSIKKADLKTMEDKIVKIIHRATKSGASTNPEMKYDTDGNISNEIYKYSVTNRIVNPSKLHNSDMNKPNSTKKKNTGSVLKEIKGKPNKKSTPAYAVNMCLCSTKREERREENVRMNLQTGSLRQKDTLSQILSAVKQSKPIKSSFLSQDTTLSYSLEYDEKSCPSNCVCFHKIPSNTSIDKLLETLAKWKVDLDGSYNEKYLYKCPFDHNINVDSKTTLKVEEKSQEKINEKKQQSLKSQGSIYKTTSETSKVKVLEKNVKQAVPIATESVYMGAVSLDKSNEEYCKCANDNIIKNNTSFECLARSKCDCEKKHEAKKTRVQKIYNQNYEQKEINVIQTNQEHTNIISIPDLPKMYYDKAINKVETQDKDVNINLTLRNTEEQMLQSSNYRINFLGVTLVDVNPNTKSELLFENNCSSESDLNELNNNAVFSKKYHSDNKKDSRKNDHDQKNHLRKIHRPVPDLTSYIENTNKNNKNILISNNDDGEDNIFINNNIIQENGSATCNKNKHENSKKLTTMIKYIDEVDGSHLHHNIKHNNSDLGYKTASDWQVSNLNNKQITNFKEKINKKISRDSDISKKSFKTASESNEFLPKNDQENFLKGKVVKTDKSSSSKKHIKATHSLQKLSCKCSNVLDEFKKYINDNIAKNAENVDIALDALSLKQYKERDESCICCGKLNNDECKNLEDNTFHLIEEYLKKKLIEFKASNCNSFCIPIEEEEKIFGTIVQRVKRLISESTYQITCKCATKDRKSRGSWNRAYGLLQEYLKIKINKIQCSCLLAEDNKDTILPDVLEKISNLIEYDFERLKNICICNEDPSYLGNKEKIEKQMIIKSEIPKKNQSVIYQNKILDFLPADNKVNFNEYEKNCLKCSMTSKSPLNLAIADENNINNDIDLLHEHKNCETKNVIKLLDERLKDSELDVICLNNKNLTTNQDKSNTEMACNHDFMGKKSINITHMTEKKYEINNTLNKSRSHISNFENALNPLNSMANLKIEQKIMSNSRHEVSDLKNKDNVQNNEESRKQHYDSILNSSKVPYIGYTVTCSCDEKLGPCICPKQVLNADCNKINDLWKNSMPDKNNLEKFIYIFPKQTTVISNQNMNSQKTSGEDDSVSQKRNTASIVIKSEAACCIKSEPIMLKTSSCDVIQTHAETNTFKESVSINTDCSHNEDAGWYECALQYNPSKHSDSDPLTKSIYYPMPIKDFDDQTKDKHVSNSNFLPKSRKHDCLCEKVPLCHVKMLVENIESKLANANCTCDSLIPKVCPVHSTMC